MDSEGSILVMIHKRIRKRESYDIDSLEIISALAQNGYPMEEPEVLEGMAKLKEAGFIRAYEDVDDFGGGTGSRITRYWGIEITPQGAMKAIDLMNQFRYGAQ